MTDELHEWARSLDTLREQAWKRLSRGVADRRAAARHPTLASVDRQGMPRARTVVLRAADRDQAKLRVYTDRYADKVDELQATPHAGIHVWDQSAHLQIRLLADVAVQVGAAVEPVWAELSEHARNCYGFQPTSGAPIADSLGYEQWPQPSAFAVLDMTIQQMDILHLGNRHRRGWFERQDEWVGRWIVP